MITISPSILAADFMNLSNELEALKSIQNLWLHLDVMDGHFVPNMTFGIPIIKQLSAITKIPLDVHLMVSNPEFYFENLSENDIHNITFHLEASPKPLELIEIAKNKFSNVGISIKPNTSIEELNLDILSKIDLVLIMSVEPGFGGQSFMDNSIPKIERLTEIRNKHNLKFKIQVDGGINLETAKLTIIAGADNLVAGSYIFKSNSNQYNNKIESLR